MFSIGQLAKHTGVKIPTIRYYEQMGLLIVPERTEGNQRRYDTKGLQRLSFIKHARSLGFTIEAISSLIKLQQHPDQSCQEATDIALSELSSVKDKIKKLKKLEKELHRIAKGCDGNSTSHDCYVLAALAEHKLCNSDH